MKLFYYCYGRSHSSVIAGSIHLKRLPDNRIPGIREILAVPEFDRGDSSDFGVPFYLGNDEAGNEVYIIGFGRETFLGLQTIYHFLRGNADPTEWKFFNSLAAVGWLTKIGGFISKKLKLPLVGKYLAAVGIRRSYRNLVELVKKAKETERVAARKVIIVTDGDRVAEKVVEKVAQNIGGRAISLSAGNPTPVSGRQIAAAIKETPKDPVLVMVDDCGSRHKGKGEKVLEELAHNPDLDILGVIAVASDTSKVMGVPVSFSITREGKIINGPVDKTGNPEPDGHRRIEGDTVDVINRLHIPLVVGLGDLGKMDDADLVEEGAKITTMAVEEILKRSNFNNST